MESDTTPTMVTDDGRKTYQSAHPSRQIAGGTGRSGALLRSVVVALITLGFIFRFRQYLANRSLWFDEACLSLNILHRTFTQLWQPLDYHQGAPIGFLLLQKSAVSLLGTSEYALRLVPLLAGIFSIFVFCKVAKRTILPEVVPLALALFAISPSLIYYSSEVKQYSSDVTIALLLLYLTIVAVQSEWKPAHTVTLGLVGSVAVWVSHPSVFVLSGTLGIILITLIACRDWRKLRSISVAFLMWAGSFTVCYFVSLRRLSHDYYLLSYWEMNFMPFPPRNVTEFKWFEDNFFGFFSSSAGLRFFGLAALAFFFGCVSFFKRDKKLLLLLLSPAIPTLAASAMHKYPFGGRLTLFLVPNALLLMSEGAGSLRRAVGNRLPLTGLLFVGLLLLDSGLYTLNRFAMPLKSSGRSMPLEELSPVMAHLKTHLQSGDAVYVYHMAQPAFEYYAERTKFPRENVVLGTASGDEGHIYESELKQFSGKRVWVLFSHMEGVAAAEPTYVKFYLGLTSSRIQSFARPGAETDLYDLRTAER